MINQSLIERLPCRDEEPPVVNLVSPPVTGTEGGEAIAAVVEDSDIVLKVSGYDNVQVSQLELRGVALQGSEYVLTGQPVDIISGADFTPQQIPGVLHAFSALKLIKIPLFSRAANTQFDLYPVSVVGIDKTGNQSTSSVTIAVGADQDPVIVTSRIDRNSYFPRDKVQLDIQARDDIAVSSIAVNYYLDGATTVLFSETKDLNSGLIPAPNVQASFSLDLATLNLSNTAHNIQAQVIATDNRGHNSNDTALIHMASIVINPDNTAPIISISQPIQGTNQYHSDSIIVGWKAVEQSELASVRFLVGGTEVHNLPVSGLLAQGTFNLTLPATGTELTIEAHAVDVYGNNGTSNWAFPLITDEPPTVSIRTPAAGSRFVEGEPFTMNALVSDNRRVISASLFIELDAQVLFNKTFDSTDIDTIQSKDGYLAAAMRTPHRPGPGEGLLKIGVRATDDNGLTTEVLLDVTILDDEEPPVFVMTEPDAPFSIMPGDSFKVVGSGDDNFYISDVVPVLVDTLGVETILNWTVFSRVDRVESQTVANPESFGSLIVGQRFYMDYEGRIEIPLSFLPEAGKTYKFKLRTSDFGFNQVETPGVNMTILADKEVPVINVIQPGDRVYDRQPLVAKVEITDNIGVASYNIFILGEETTPLATVAGLSDTSISRNDLTIDLNKYIPIPALGKNITLVVQATDTTGNVAEEKHTLLILPDLPPVLSIIDPSPTDNIVKGNAVFHTMVMVDDYVSTADSVKYFPLYSSLKGLGAGGARQPTGQIEQVFDNLGALIDTRSFIDILYPEAIGMPVSLTIND